MTTATPRHSFVTPEVRLAFPNFFEPKAFKRNGKDVGAPKYSVLMVFKPDDLDDLKAEMKKAALAKFGSGRLKEVRWPVQAGDAQADRLIAKGKDPERVEFMRGHMLVKTASLYAPEVVGADRRPIVNPRLVYSGVFGHVAGFVNTYEADDGTPGVNLYFDKVLITRDGERLSGGRSAADVFAGVKGGVSAMDPTEDLDDEIPF